MEMRSGAQSWIDVINLVLGAILFMAPWALAPAAAGEQWNAWIAGGLIVLIACSALAAFSPWQEWGNLVLGFWAAISPLVFGFEADAGATMTHVIVGCGVFALAAIQLWLVGQRAFDLTD